MKEMKPGNFSTELQLALGIAEGIPPPWLINMQVPHTYMHTYIQYRLYPMPYVYIHIQHTIIDTIICIHHIHHIHHILTNYTYDAYTYTHTHIHIHIHIHTHTHTHTHTHVQRYGPPPSYPALKLPGLNAPLPAGASYGYQPGIYTYSIQ
jgi:hypothetical protein